MVMPLHRLVFADRRCEPDDAIDVDRVLMDAKVKDVSLRANIIRMRDEVSEQKIDGVGKSDFPIRRQKDKGCLDCRENSRKLVIQICLRRMRSVFKGGGNRLAYVCCSFR